ncbi:MAG: hypothetical protein MMC23_009077 [Stictis urceolatum]|nr:hypothetical protein [Stictis urceolata]
MSTVSTTENLASDLKPSGSAAAQVKPCCVCKDEKAARDECMLFSNSNDPQADCQSMVQKYRNCMKGYGFDMK